jgi:hypothetical protein
VQKPFVDLNNLLKYSAKTNEAIGREGTMLDLEQFDQRLSEKLA